MKTTTFKSLMYMSLLALVIGVSSCSKKKLEDSTVSSEDNGTAETMFADVFAQSDEAAKEDDDKKTSAINTDSCRIVTREIIDSATFHRKITIDFGTGCTGSDGRTRKGKIIIDKVGKYRLAGSVLTITLDGYHVNDNHIEGTKTIKNNGRNTSNQLNYSVEVSDGKVTTAIGEVITWESTRTNTWVEGESTLFNIFDDVYEISGGASGINREGESFALDITEVLRKEIGCRWIVKGKVSLTHEDLDDKAIIDFGDGTCDNKAVMTYKNKTKDITLK